MEKSRDNLILEKQRVELLTLYSVHK